MCGGDIKEKDKPSSEPGTGKFILLHMIQLFHLQNRKGLRSVPLDSMIEVQRQEQVDHFLYSFRFLAVGVISW